MPNGSGLLAGVTVLDLTQFLSGPYATLVLGDLGARIIKVEPLDGDMSRTIAPHFVGNDSAYFLSVNRNKESLAINLKESRGRDTLLRLVESCDIVVENFRPGVADRLGIGYNKLRAANPKVVLCSISGFGQDGPYRDRPAYDIIVQSLSGGMSITGEPGGTPVRAGLPVADLSAGLFGVIGIVAALLRARSGGDGAHIDVSMLDCQISMLTYQASYYLASGEVPGPQGDGHLSIPTYRAFTCRDGVRVMVAANTERMWRGLCEAVARFDLPADPRFLNNSGRLEHRSELDPLLEEAFAQLDSRNVLENLLRLKIPASAINSLDRALADPQVEYRDMVLKLHGGGGRQIRVAGNPIKVRGEAAASSSYPPGLGEHNRKILSELAGLSATEIASLEGNGLIGSLSHAASEPVAALGEHQEEEV